MRVHSGFLLACTLLTTMACIDDAAQAHAEVYESLASTSSAQSGGQENTPVANAIADRRGEGTLAKKFQCSDRYRTRLWVLKPRTLLQNISSYRRSNPKRISTQFKGRLKCGSS